MLKENGGFYSVTIKGELDKLESSFNTLCTRLFSSSYIPFSTPGISGRSAESITIDEADNFSLSLYQIPISISENKDTETVCRHEGTDLERIGNIIGFSASTSYHHRRDGLDISKQQGIPRRPTNPKKICKACGILALIGMWYATFIFSITDREVIVIPIPKEQTSGTQLQEVFSLQHQIRKDWISQEIPQTLIPLTFLSRIPSSADILKGFDLYIAVMSRQQGYHVDGLFLIPIDNYLSFLRASSYNVASVDTMLRNEAFGALQELNYSILNSTPAALSKFARLYIQETSTNNFTNLLYPETAKYLLKEVAMIDSQIIENSALGSLARTLRYFIRERKYGYADDIRNARKESRDFEETIAKMLREGRLRLEQKEKIHLPTDEEMKEVFRLANDDFDKVKTALVILAFSFPSRAEESTT
jgi:CRISPR type I-A-associated protein Csa5